MAPATKSNTGEAAIRLNLAITPKVDKRIRRLKEDSEAASVTEVIRRALAVYEEMIAIRKEGGRVIIENSDGSVEALRIV